MPLTRTYSRVGTAPTAADSAASHLKPGRRHTYTTPTTVATVARKDPSIGFTKDNTILVCKIFEDGYHPDKHAILKAWLRIHE